MPSARKNRRQKMQHVSANRKRMRKNKKKEKSANITCKTVKDAWNKNKSTKQNLMNMGIAFDPNKVLPVPRKLPGPTIIADEVLPKPQLPQSRVLQDMEVEAASNEREKSFQLPSNDVHFCIYMMEKYKEDYKAMSRDRKNFFQLTPKQIRNKIRTFKRSKVQYQNYLDSKHSITNNTCEGAEMDTV